MKASLKFRDEQKPLFRAKVPVSILGFPFQSGIVAGESKELSLNLTTFLNSGPSMKIGYKPNDSQNPFSLVFKTGIGHFGSPISSSMTMSAEFNLIANQNPTFFVHFKPQFGDFSVKKSQSSVFGDVANLKSKVNCDVSDEDGSVDLVDSSGFVLENGIFPGGKITKSPVAGVVKSVFSGLEVSARTSMPVRNRALVNFRWGVRFPAEMTKMSQNSRVSVNSLPVLVMNKIGIEHLAMEDLKGSNKGEIDVADACLNLKHQLDVIQSDNGNLRKSIDELKSEIVSGRSCLPAGVSRTGRFSDKKALESNLNVTDGEELKKID